MGEAKRRGTFEERKSQAIQREKDNLAAAQLRRQLIQQQEIDAYSVMVWWQIEMSEERSSRIMRKRLPRPRSTCCDVHVSNEALVGGVSR